MPGLVQGLGGVASVSEWVPWSLMTTLTGRAPRGREWGRSSCVRPAELTWPVSSHALIGPQDSSCACVDPIGWRTGLSEPITRAPVLLCALSADV